MAETGESTINEEYLSAVRDWVANGAQSAFLMDEGRLDSRLPDLEFDDVSAAASFQLGTYLAVHGHPEDALIHFKRAHALHIDEHVVEFRRVQVSFDLDHRINTFYWDDSDVG